MSSDFIGPRGEGFVRQAPSTVKGTGRVMFGVLSIHYEFSM